MTWKKYLYLGLAVTALVIGLYVQRLRDIRAARAGSTEKLALADVRLEALSLAVGQRDEAIAGLDNALAEKAKDIRKKTAELEKRARVISKLRNKKTHQEVKDVSVDCKTCFDNNTKAVTVRIDNLVVYHDPDCLDDFPGALDLGALSKKLCKPYQDAARDIVSEALLAPPPKFAELTNRSQPYLRAATDGVSIGYRHGLFRVGRLHVEPNAEIQFDHRDGTVRWSAGITVPIDVGKLK